jgi:hypothetical protein
MKSNKKLICKMIASGKTYDELRQIYQKKFLKPFNYRTQGPRTRVQAKYT